MTTITIPTRYADIIDSLDVIAAIEYYSDLVEDNPESLDDDQREEYAALRLLAEEGEGSEDWKYGVALIRDSYFVEYAQDFAEENGMIPSDRAWPNYCIDWDRAARELRMDYFSVEFDGVTYWIG